MHTYCTSCGSMKENNGKLLCDQCLSRAETAGASEIRQNETVPNSNALQLDQYWDIIKKFAVQPLETARAAFSGGDVKQGAVIGLAASIVMALFGMLFLRKIWYAVLAIFGGGIGYELSEALFGPMVFPYGEVFFKLLLMFVIQWALLALVTTGIGYLFGLPIRFVQSLNVVAYTKLSLAVSIAAALILSFIYTPLAIAVMAAGMLAGYVLIARTVSEEFTATGKRFYFLPSVCIAYFTLLYILINLFF